jgi:hypothetical protein
MGPEMAGTNEKYGITQFQGKNFDHWKFRVETVLEEQDVKCCIEELPPERRTEVWEKKDKKLKAIDPVHCGLASRIRERQTAWDIWKSLTNTFDRKGIASNCI